jgi:hypothetical protein
MTSDDLRRVQNPIAAYTIVAVFALATLAAILL